ncbi:MAG: efflux RND transporter periplasmic adaptor subunit [Chromatiales bacterium]|nr:efflux RND transporter periplasmic adaptor subunit [Chromatiales bacterium]
MLAGAAVAALANDRDSAPSPAAAGLETAVATVEVVARERRLDGVVEAVHEATISAQTAGQVAEVLYDVQDVVEKDAIVVRLRDTEQRAALNKAEADLAEAQAVLREQQANYKRVAELKQRDVVSQAEFDKVAAGLKTAEARAKAAEAGVKRAREQVEYTVVRAPYTGIVTKRHVNVGESVNPGTPIMAGFSLEKLRVRAEVPQRLIEPVRALKQARVLTDGGRSLAVSKLTIFPYATEGSNSFVVRLDLDEADGELFPGMFVKVAFVVGIEERLVVPRSALTYRGEVTGVYVQGNDGALALRQVRPGRQITEERIEVLGGLLSGERVATDPIRAGVQLREQLKAAKRDG